MSEQSHPFNIPSAPPFFSEMLKRSCVQANIDLTEDQIEKLRFHAEWLFFWNRRTNLTAIKGWNEIITRHYMDSLVPAARWLPRKGKALDIGSGAGFPGIPIKVLFPMLEMVLCETRRKKVSFLKGFIGRSSISNLSVEGAPWIEILGKYQNQFDLVTCRALKLTSSELSKIRFQGLTDKGVIALWTTPEYIERQNFDGDLLPYETLDGRKRILLIIKRGGINSAYV